MFDAVILAGGGARRLSGVDKPAVMIGGESLLDRVLAAVAAAGTTVVVGPERPVRRPVLWSLEDPPGGGPVAALAAGLAHTRADCVVVLAADLPWIAPAVPRLIEALTTDASADCAALVCDARRNYLAAAWRRPALVAAISRLGDVRNQSMRRLCETATIIEVPDVDDAGHDCDTWTDINDARSRVASIEELP